LFVSSYCLFVQLIRMCQKRTAPLLRLRHSPKIDRSEVTVRKVLLSVFAASLLLLSINTQARPHPTRLAGIVLRPNGKRAVNAMVLLERSDGSAPLAKRTNVQGAFVFTYIRPGLYDVRAAEGRDATVWRHNVMVHAGRETYLTLRLEPIPPRRQR